MTWVVYFVETTLVSYSSGKKSKPILRAKINLVPAILFEEAAIGRYSPKVAIMYGANRRQLCSHDAHINYMVAGS